MISVSIVIVTWNAEQFIKKCLDSVLNQQAVDFEIIVVDNHSTDQTLNILENYSNRIILIKNSENNGFCKANNQAISIAKGEFIFTLNSDVELEENYLKSLIDYLEEHQEVGMAQAKLLRNDKKTIDCLGLYLSALMRFYNVGEGRADGDQYGRPFEIFGPCAAAAVYRKSLFEDINYKGQYFDEKFFFLVEDFDVAWRARKSGWKAAYVPYATAYHYRKR